MKGLGIATCFVFLSAFASTNQVPLHVGQPTTNAVAKAEAHRAVTPERTQCWAITKSGKRCSRKAVSGERFCRQHLKSRTHMAP